VSWDFSTDPEFQKKLDWADSFVTGKVQPLDIAFPHLSLVVPTPERRAVLEPLKQQVRDQGLWACHLGPELDGKGYGQVKLALLNEILGRSEWGPIIFGCQAPDTGNAEILAHYGTEEQKKQYLQGLLDGEVFSAYSMTEPLGGSDPRSFRTRARRDGDDWILTGEKYFSTNARNAAFLVVMAVTNPDIEATKGMSMFLVPTETPGVEIVRNIGLMGEPPGAGIHGWVRYNDVRLSADHLLGQEGGGFKVAQVRLGGGRIHHAMRTIARCQLALDMMCRRALSRASGPGRLADRQLVQVSIAESWTQILQFRLMVLYTAWLIDQQLPAGTRKEIAACKVQAAQVLHDVVYRAIQMHGALGVSDELPLADLWREVPVIGLVDGATPVHQTNLARQILRDYEPYEGTFPPEWLPPRRETAQVAFADALEHHVANL
jgi:acyl-CoA dehydrogenase